MENNTNILSLATVKTPCAICGVFDNSICIYPAKFYGENLDTKTFSARRFYDQKIHFKIVECKNCGLWRSDPIVDSSIISTLYKGSSLTYDEHITNLRATYGKYLDDAVKFSPSKSRMLEIGCGNGFFLEEALLRGFTEVWGVEPATEAIEKAASNIRPFIKQGMFSDDLFPKEYFDVICIFQTLEHFLEPHVVIDNCLKLLKPGGVVLAINHNVNAPQISIFGEKSPVIDIEHIYLFNKKTMAALFKSKGFKVKRVFNVLNKHSLGYLATLLPIKPVLIKNILINILNITRLAKLSPSIPIGNMGIIAKKP